MSRDIKIAVIGLGYVGLPLAVALARHFSTLGYDIDTPRINELRNGHDRTHEIDADRLKASNLRLSDKAGDCHGADIFIITVPTPITSGNMPDLGPIISATHTVGRLLEPAKEQIVVYESTVYPGVTEDICGPLLEEISSTVCGKDFFLGYSPERINPGDREHTVDRITKVISGQTMAVTDRLANIYGAITSGGVFRAKNIKAAEAAKVIENAQRDINIAFVNETAIIFQKLGISIYDVLDAAATKWNFLKFAPGLVGGHCIGVDPYYLSYKAQEVGYQPAVILAGRSVNDGMGTYIADRVHDHLQRAARILVLGFTFKENVPDLRNSKVADVVKRLCWLGHEVTVCDPLANSEEAQHEYGVSLACDLPSGPFDAVVLAVAHQDYVAMSGTKIASLLKRDGLVVDIKGAWRNLELPFGFRRWQL
jgi:UDP-N-acetyl-D-galactosamine dehydrogenase